MQRNCYIGPRLNLAYLQEASPCRGAGFWYLLNWARSYSATYMCYHIRLSDHLSVAGDNDRTHVDLLGAGFDTGDWLKDPNYVTSESDGGSSNNYAAENNNAAVTEHCSSTEKNCPKNVMDGSTNSIWCNPRLSLWCPDLNPVQALHQSASMPATIQLTVVKGHHSHKDPHIWRSLHQCSTPVQHRWLNMDRRASLECAITITIGFHCDLFS